ncbi:CubicO group peptidase, beta-lactamase class C family [Amphibacillus marinus]|uniref:CubicO group peptidase, beta-lactamase class C family n=1 Tax=Amphibacillus marinus TaxID=872970 RepID=A0A1H8KD83_9BACI|nr:serine hydrolase domain-containing protein [Amphibacillus marinus]SEN90943.1 CubicO group peptidase, beta-lactamase class C family [Amphibacillus marinus]
MTDHRQFDQIVARMIKNKYVKGAVLHVKKGHDFSWSGGAGSIEADQPFFIASVTKFFVTAIVLQLLEQQQLCLADPITKYLAPSLTNKLHVKNGIEYTSQITIKHLISNTSGIADYYSSKSMDGKVISHDLAKGIDKAWPLEEVIIVNQKLAPKFVPGEKRKVHYSDTNYQLLGRILENITGLTIAELFQHYVFDKVELADSYVYLDPEDKKPAPFYYHKRKLWVPNYMTSVPVEGGIVSTGTDLIKFMTAFFSGQLFDQQLIEELKDWRRIWFPGQFYFGVGLEKLWTPRFIAPRTPINELLGFWGQTGSFAFYNPERDVYLTGTVNQANGLAHSSAFKAMISCIKQLSE